MLNQLQEKVFDFIKQETLDAKRRFANGERVVDQINVAAGYAFALHRDLTIAGKPPTFGKIMLKNRMVPTTDPEFFCHLHALEDFVVAVQYLVQKANGDTG